MAAETSFRAARIARYLADRQAPRRVSPTALVAGLNYTFAVSVAIILWDADRTLQRIAAIVVLLTVVPAVVWMRRALTRATMGAILTEITAPRQADRGSPVPVPAISDPMTDGL